MNKLMIKSVVALMFVAFCSSSAMAQIDSRPYFGSVLPTFDLRTLAVSLTTPQNGVAWAFSQRGKRVGRGECTDLVAQHLAVSGARPADYRIYRNYIWGAIPTNGWRTGDVIQFEQCIFRTVTPTSWSEWRMEHHSAIIVSASGSTIQVLHQNAPFGGPVKLDTIDLSKKVQGTFIVWRPVRM